MLTPGRTLAVLYEQQRVAMLRDAGDIWQLEYTPEWRNAPAGFDLAPSLPRSKGTIVDGASDRRVQWFFDNLLPEEGARTLLAREAGIDGGDAFALLAHYGAESAGALTLLPPGTWAAPAGLRPLGDGELHARIARLPRQSLAAHAPKRMSLAGAQHKLAITIQDNAWFEPEGSAPSTHILKPDHRDTESYPHSVANEWFVMQLAARTGLAVPPVLLHYVPDPVYLIERFDRVATATTTRRLHAIDACQLLGLPRQFKYRAANIDALRRCAEMCRARAVTRQRLYRWLVFNLLVGNHDAHLKNLSYLVSADSVSLAAHYDLLSTVLYDVALDNPGHWRTASLPIALEGADDFGSLQRAHVIAAGAEIGLGRGTSTRILDEMILQLPARAAELYGQLENAANQRAPDALHAGELRLLRQINHVVIAEMAMQLQVR